MYICEQGGITKRLQPKIEGMKIMSENWILLGHIPLVSNAMYVILKQQHEVTEVFALLQNEA